MTETELAADAKVRRLADVLHVLREADRVLADAADFTPEELAAALPRLLPLFGPSGPDEWARRFAEDAQVAASRVGPAAARFAGKVLQAGRPDHVVTVGNPAVFRLRPSWSTAGPEVLWVAAWVDRLPQPLRARIDADKVPLVDGRHILVLGADPVGPSVPLQTALMHSAEARRLDDERERGAVEERERERAQKEHDRLLRKRLRDAT